MIVRPLDENGDIFPIYSIEQMIGGKEAVSQIINLRLHLLYGEWWEDRELGFRIPDLLIANARRGDVDILSKYIASYVSSTQGVAAVTGIVNTYINRKMTFLCTALTNEGKSTTLEVNLNGIL